MRLFACVIATIAFTLGPVLQPEQEPGLRPAGTGYVITSRLLGEARPVHLRLPASYESTGPARRYPVVVVLDGESLLEPSARAAESLARNGQMPEVILVGLPNTDRLRDLTPPGLSVSGSSLNEGGSAFLDFIEKELLPALEREHRAGPLRVLVGHSSGGILASWAAASRNGFGFVLALDTPAHLGEGWLADRFASPDRTAPLRFAAIDARFGWSDALWQRATGAAPAGWSMWRETLELETHNSMVGLGTYLGLRRLFADYSVVTAPAAPVAAALTHYRDLSDRYEMPLAPPRSLLRQLMEDRLLEGRADDAGVVLDMLVDNYGAPADIDDLRARINEAARRPAPEETVETLLSMPMPPAAQMAPFVGEWLGVSWTQPGVTSRMALRIRVDDGLVVAEAVTWPGGPEKVQPIEHLRVTADGLAFGYLNGMRPRGVLMYEGALSGDVLEGRMRLAGMEFRLPDGRELPPVFFRLERRRGLR